MWVTMGWMQLLRPIFFFFLSPLEAHANTCKQRKPVWLGEDLQSWHPSWGIGEYRRNGERIKETRRKRKLPPIGLLEQTGWTRGAQPCLHHMGGGAASAAAWVSSSSIVSIQGSLDSHRPVHTLQGFPLCSMHPQTQICPNWPLKGGEVHVHLPSKEKSMATSP